MYGATPETPTGHFEHTAQHLIMIAVLLIGYNLATYCPLEHAIFHSCADCNGTGNHVSWLANKKKERESQLEENVRTFVGGCEELIASRRWGLRAAESLG